MTFVLLITGIDELYIGIMYACWAVNIDQGIRITPC